MSDIVFAADADFEIVAGAAEPLVITVPAQGPQGPQGPAGPTGAAGSNGSNGADGADGADGVNALGLSSGSGAPDDGDGADGDFYINTANGDVYRKASGSWGSPAMNIIGPPGADGDDGADGADGADGVFSAIASQAEAEAGGDNTKGMTPLRVAQAIAALVSPSAVPAGTVVFTILSTAPAGWLLFADQTIGDASSGATYANSLAQAVFTALFDNASDANCPILTSAGAATTRAAQTDAATAFAAHCRMTMPKALGRALAVAGAGAGLTSRALGAALGEEAHALTAAENGPHVHDVPYTLQQAPLGNDTNLVSAVGAPAGNHGDSASSGSGTAHNTMQPTVFLNAMVKL